MIIPLKTGRTMSYIIKENGTILVDTGMDVSIEKFTALLAEKGIEPKEIDLIIITHGHIDHFLILSDVQKSTKAKVMCHKIAEDALKSGKSVPVVLNSKFGAFLMKLFGAKKPDNYSKCMPDILLDNETNLKPYGINGKVILTPGHTDCSISIITETGEAITGDFFLSFSLFPKKVNLTFVAIDPSQMMESLKKLTAYNCSKYYGAHGGPFTKKGTFILLKNDY